MKRYKVSKNNFYKPQKLTQKPTKMNNFFSPPEPQKPEFTVLSPIPMGDNSAAFGLFENLNGQPKARGKKPSGKSKKQKANLLNLPM